MQAIIPTHGKSLALLAVLLVMPVFAGCFGDEAPKVDEDKNGEGVTVVATGDDEDANENEEFEGHEGPKNDPAAHHHHYWGDLESVTLYDGDVPFNNYDMKYMGLNGYQSMAWAEFDLETDGDDVSDPFKEAVQGGKADTVFAGTDRIEVIFPDNLPPGTGALLFQYKSSGTPRFMPENGMLVHASDIKVITLDEVGMADPPHQFTSSRWDFRLIAVGGQCQDLQLAICPPTVIDPASNPDPSQPYIWEGLKMIAYNGGEKALDPPHPDFWTAGDVLPLGGAAGEVDGEVPAVQTPLVRERIGSMTDIRMPPNNIVPLGTEYVEVKVTWDNKIAPPEGTEFFLALRFHGADSLDYKEPAATPDGTANPVSKEGNTHVYKLYDYDAGSEKSYGMTDPPYEANSFWRFQLIPSLIVNGEPQYNTGAFQGDWSMEFTAHKIPNYVLT